MDKIDSPHQKSSRTFKDTFFRTLFHDNDRALELCNALEGTNFPKGTPVQFFSHETASLKQRNSDLAFVVNDQLLAMTEHQGSINPNMPLRYLPYIAEVLYTWLDKKKDLYKNKLVMLPTPKFYVLYNGKEELQQDILRLSDAFKFKDKKFSMEIEVKIINISFCVNNNVLKKSHSLEEYSYLIQRINENLNKGQQRDKAISTAVKHCIESGVLAEFLKENFMEVCDMLSWEVTYEEIMEARAEDAMEKGLEKGMEKGMEKGLESGLLTAAMKFIEKGMSLQDVAGTLNLTESQIIKLKETMA